MRRASGILYLVSFIIGLVQGLVLSILGIVFLAMSGATSGEEAAVATTTGVIYLLIGIFALVTSIIAFSKRKKVLNHTDNTSTHVGAIVCGALFGNALLIAGGILGLVAVGKESSNATPSNFSSRG